MYPDVLAVFSNTGQEYPEIQKHVKSFDNVKIIRPEKNFLKVIEEDGYPVISKEVSEVIENARRYEARHDGAKTSAVHKKLLGLKTDKNGNKSPYNLERYNYLMDAPFKITSKCCNYLKKQPFKTFEKETGLHPVTGISAQESILRKTNWLRHGCNNFEGTRIISHPLSVWTEQDILEYIYTFNIKLASIYGDVKKDENGKFYTTGVDRTGCMFCLFGAHREPEPNRIQKLAKTHPNNYDFYMNKLHFNEIMEWLKIPYKPIEDNEKVDIFKDLKNTEK